MLEKSPRKNAARLFVNWLLSREGQLLQYAETFAVPVQKALQSPDFLPFADTIVGKPSIVRDESLLATRCRRWCRRPGAVISRRRRPRNRRHAECEERSRSGRYIGGQLCAGGWPPALACRIKTYG